MPLKVFKVTSNARRQMIGDDFSDVTKSKPEKSLIYTKKKTGGRNNTGKITVRHIGGGSKRYIRIVDFKRDKFDIPAKVFSIEYDPNRSSRIALLVYADGEKRYIVAPTNLKVGDKVMSSQKKVDIKPGNVTCLKNIPTGMLISHIELNPGKGAKMVRSAGLGAKLMAVEGKYAQLRMPSGEIRLVPKDCLAMIGTIGNAEKMHQKIGKAGRQRNRGIKPTVRGKAMNPCDHPHGGGEGGCPIGLKQPKTPWGKPALGVKTRKRKKAGSKLIIRRRSKKRR